LIRAFRDGVLYSCRIEFATSQFEFGLHNVTLELCNPYRFGVAFKPVVRLKCVGALVTIVGSRKLSQIAEHESMVVRVGKYYAHGAVLGIVAFVSFLAFAYPLNTGSPYYGFWTSISPPGGPLLGASLLIGVSFVLLGGSNLAVASLLWESRREQSIGNGMRDGFLIQILIQIVNLPAAIILLAFLHPSSPRFDMVFGLMLAIPAAAIYLPLYGLIGKGITNMFAGNGE
jgi:hypothetical protein